MWKSQRMMCMVGVLALSACAKGGSSRATENAAARAAENRSAQANENRAKMTKSEDRQQADIPPPPDLRLEQHDRLADSLPGMSPTTPVGPGVAALPSSPPLPGPSSEQVQTAPKQRAPRTTRPPASAKTLTDGQILEIITSVDSAEIEQARLIESKSKDERVKAFAAHMIADHSRSKEKAQKLEKDGKVTPASSDTGKDLSESAQAMLKSLKQASGHELDRLYAQGQVDQHQRVLDLIKNKLQPNASSPELKTQLEDARSMVAGHFEEAQALKQHLIRSAAFNREQPSPTASR